MYGSCACLQEAKEAFYNLPRFSTHSWNIFIRACVKCGSFADAMDAFSQMLMKETDFLSSTMVCVFDVCSSVGDIVHSRLAHAISIEMKFEGEVMVDTAIFKMYGGLSCLNEAWNVFNSMLHLDVIAWSSMIAVCARHNHRREACELYRQMQHTCIVSDSVACLCALSACTGPDFLTQGKQIHVSVLEMGCDGDAEVGTSLVNMYGTCTKFNESSSAFHRILRKSLVTWNSMITICVLSGLNKEALVVFSRMQLEGFLPDEGSYVSALNACSNPVSTKEGHRIHSTISINESGSCTVLGTALSKMYGKCGHLQDAIKVFNMLKAKDVVSWCTIMTACTENGFDHLVFSFFYSMQLTGSLPDAAVYVCALDGCGNVADIDKGRELHTAIAEAKLECNIPVGTALIDMYGKCGSFHDAKRVFSLMPGCNMVTWSAIIAAYAHSGEADEAIRLFQEMPCHDQVPNDVTFRSVLTACSHSGQVYDGIHYFLSLCQEKGLLETEEHQMSMIDLLSRAGHLDAAEILIESVAVQKKALAWSCLLGACKLHGDVERGERIASEIYRLDPENAASLITLLHLYGDAKEETGA
ncbi:hypothetical protein KP509_38G063600 [Ceratopteris richardii]|nr:hypothetical protein KP509_38G063600 [Ceratopteris richardii]